METTMKKNDKDVQRDLAILIGLHITQHVLKKTAKATIFSGTGVLVASLFTPIATGFGLAIVAGTTALAGAFALGQCIDFNQEEREDDE